MAKVIDLKIYGAGSGDSFLLQFDNESNIMIDMGYGYTYKKEIKNDFLNLSRQSEMIDLLMITHIDKDHISGAIPFFEDNGHNNEIIEVAEVWHNSYRHLQFNKEKVDGIDDKEKLILQNIIKSNQLNSQEDGIQQKSYKQGSSLAQLLYQYKYQWNSSFYNNAIRVNDFKTITIKDDINILVLSPNKTKLDELASKWLKELKKKKYNFDISDEEIFDDAFEFYMRSLKEQKSSIQKKSAKKDNLDNITLTDGQDKEPPNGSSMACIIEYKNKKLLFLGDAHEDIIYDNLTLLQENGYELNFDLVKLSHHGSNNNTSVRLVDLVESDTYIISTSGASHNHPDLETIAKIVRKKTTYTKKLIFNYDLGIFSEIEPFKDKYNFETLITNEYSI